MTTPRDFPRSAMILAAGSGSRLGPITASTHKCMVIIDGKPAMQYAIEGLRDAGISRIIVNVCYLREQITEYFGDGAGWGVSLQYSVEEEPLGTAGGVANASWFFEGKPFLVWYGDNVSNCRLDRLWSLHCESAGVLTMAVYARPDVSQSGVAVIGDGNRILRFVEKPAARDGLGNWVNAGIYAVEPEVLAAVAAGKDSDFGKDIFPSLLADGQSMHAYRMGPGEDLVWLDTPADYAAAIERRISSHL